MSSGGMSVMTFQAVASVRRTDAMAGGIIDD
jgi:hypothetical protein